MANAGDYFGRTIDLAAFQNVPAGRGAPEAELTQVLALDGTGGSVVTSIQKLAQRFLVELFTPIGSLPYLPLRGTGLVAAVLSGRIQTDQDFYAAWSFAVGQAQANLNAEELVGDPLDERMGGAVLTRLAIAAGEVTLWINVTSRSGTGVRVIQPLSTVP